LPPFIDLTNEDVNDVLLLSPDSIDSHAEILNKCADDQVPITNLKRKRGRPEKIIASTSTPTGMFELLDHTADGQLPLTNLKRKRGGRKRILGSTSTQTKHEKITVTPTTYPTISSEILDHTADDQVPFASLKRKRGRPKKKIIGSTSTQIGVDLRDQALEKRVDRPTPYTTTLSEVLHHSTDDQVPPTNQTRKRGRPKKMLASTSTQS
ncbi:Ditrans,polycis-undecaprenyl-diphosphate synthase ((2E,6E)-farnesyl-diphosphate specific), partial [Striga asiatica]